MLQRHIARHPFVAVGIGTTAGVLLGLLGPKPRPGRITPALIAALGTLGYRLMRDAAVAQIGKYVAQWLAGSPEPQEFEHIDGSVEKAATNARL